MKRIPRATIKYPFPHEFHAAKYSQHYLLSHVPENAVQRAILELLHRYFVDAIAIDAGLKSARRDLIAKSLLHGLDRRAFDGGLGEIAPGHPDIAATLAPTGRSLYIEVKAPAWTDENGKVLRRAGKPSQEQLDLLLSKFDRGAIVMIAYSVDDVANFIPDQLRMNFEAMRSEAR
jgi:hypothetical protein